MSKSQATIAKNRSRFFDRFIMAGLLMNVLVVSALIIFWILH